jgi:hypothetical protein
LRIQVRGLIKIASERLPLRVGGLAINMADTSRAFALFLIIIIGDCLTISPVFLLVFHRVTGPRSKTRAEADWSCQWRGGEGESSRWRGDERQVHARSTPIRMAIATVAKYE